MNWISTLADVTRTSGLVLQQKARLTFDRDRLLGQDRIVVLVLEVLAVIGAATGLGFVLTIDPSPELARKCLFLMIIGALIAALFPVVDLFPLLRRQLPEHWPISTLARIVAQWAYAAAGFWASLFVALALTAALVLRPSAAFAALLAALAGAGGVTSAALLLRTIADRVMRGRWGPGRLTLLAAIAAGVWIVFPGIVRDPTRSALVPGNGVVGLLESPSSSTWRAGAAIALVSLSWTALYFLVSAVGTPRREPGVRDRPTDRGRLPLFANVEASPLLRWMSPPARVVASQQLCYMLRSRRVWFQIAYVPILGSILAQRMPGVASLRALIFLICLQAGSGMFLYNGFGFDGGGSWFWAYGPVSPRHVLLGKNAAVWILSIPNLLIAAFGTAMMFHLGWARGIAGAILVQTFLLFHAMVGNSISTSHPSPVDPADLWRTFVHGPAVPLLLLTAATSSVVLGLVWWATVGSPLTSMLSQIGLLALSGFLYARELGRASLLAGGRWERLALIVSKAD